MLSIPRTAPCLGVTVLFKLVVPKDKGHLEHAFIFRKAKVNADKNFKVTL